MGSPVASGANHIEAQKSYIPSYESYIRMIDLCEKVCYRQSDIAIEDKGFLEASKVRRLSEVEIFLIKKRWREFKEIGLDNKDSWQYTQLVVTLQAEEIFKKLPRKYMNSEYPRHAWVKKCLLLNPINYANSAGYCLPLLPAGSAIKILALKPYIVLCDETQARKEGVGGLPDEVFLNCIFPFLTELDLVRLAGVNRKFQSLAYCELLKKQTFALPYAIPKLELAQGARLDFIEHIRKIVNAIYEITRDERAYALLHLISLGRISPFVLIDIYQYLCAKKTEAVLNPPLPTHMISL